MKTIKYIIAIFFISYFAVIKAQNSSVDIDKIIICLGERNPDLNEAKYKSLHFYYTPKLEVVENIPTNNYTVKGLPKILEEWSDKQDLQFHTLIFDKNGYVAWEGVLNPGNSILSSAGYNNISFKEAIKRFVHNNETVIPSDRDLRFYSNQSVYRGKYYHYPFVEKQLVHFFVYDKSYKSFSIKSLVETGKPVFLLFFYYENKATITEEEVLYKQSIKSSNQINFNQKLINIDNMFSVLETIF